jgi:methylase of polypeptide subunit release factors
MTWTQIVPEALVALGEALATAKYRFVTVTPATHQRVNARNGDAFGASLRDVFGWSRPFDRDTLAPPLVGLMRAAGVLDDRGQGWRARVRAATLGDHLYFHSPYPTTDEDAVFFGPDTYRFMAAIERTTCGLEMEPRRIADIGCGAGPAAIGLARRYPAAHVCALDINDAALALTAVNARLAGAANVAVYKSDLLSGVDGEFDLIVSNPPYLLDSSKRAYRDGGGERGAGLALAIVAAALERLRDGGSLMLYTGVAITAEGDAFRKEIEPLLERSCSAWCYEELDPDIFGEELSSPGYEDTERIAAVWLHAVKRHDRNAGAEAHHAGRA